MNKETFSELGYIIVTAICVCLLAAILTGSFFTQKMRDTVAQTIPEHEQMEYISNDAFRDYIQENGGFAKQGGKQ